MQACQPSAASTLRSHHIANVCVLDPDGPPLPLQIGVLQWFAKLWEIDKQDYWG